MHHCEGHACAPVRRIHLIQRHKMLEAMGLALHDGECVPHAAHGARAWPWSCVPSKGVRGKRVSAGTLHNKSCAGLQDRPTLPAPPNPPQ